MIMFSHVSRRSERNEKKEASGRTGEHQNSVQANRGMGEDTQEWEEKIKFEKNQISPTRLQKSLPRVIRRKEPLRERKGGKSCGNGMIQRDPPLYAGKRQWRATSSPTPRPFNLQTDVLLGGKRRKTTTKGETRRKKDWGARPGHLAN